ncbi:tRNA uridine(34) 5-carboxymethylaminomethyl modification radical SAM/GNAT enzyme Elp3 [Nanoarchaeota archaeon]
MDFYQDIIKSIKKRRLSKDSIAKLKTKLCLKYKVKEIPTDIDILLNANPREVPKLRKYLMTKPTRTISGVAVCAIMTKPFKCPHGKCITCPGGVNSIFGSVPQSYTGNEPATMRGIRNNFDPYLQVFNRIEHYVILGQNPEKMELIVMGGTFPSFPKKYREDFITYALKAMNDFSDLFYKKRFDIVKFKKYFGLPGAVGDKKRVQDIQKKLLKLKGKSSLKKEQKRNEKAKIKCVGMTIETRPDYGKLKHGNEMLRLGATRVELGIQSVYDDVLKKINRGHTVKDSIESIRTLKDLGFKLNFHYMPGLFVSKQKDLKGMVELFENSDFKPDMLKIYPCIVIKGTKLYDLWKKKKYKPLTTKNAAQLIAEFKKRVPSYCRIMRVQRDIPGYLVEGGVNKTNLRQYIQQAMKKKGVKCGCIRCREPRGKKIGKTNLRWLYYKASKGIEFFISEENKDNILGFCRLRFPSKNLRKEISDDSALIRELHVYGEVAGIGEKGKIQHKGIGKKLLKEAENIAKTYHKKKMVILSGIGVREYYLNLGYLKEGPYVVKYL